MNVLPLAACSLALVTCIVTSFSACSSDDTPAAKETPDASTPQDGSVGGDGGAPADQDAAPAEFVQATFGAKTTTFPRILSAELGLTGGFEIIAVETTSSLFPEVSLTFPPQSGPAACNTALVTAVGHAISDTERYATDKDAGACSLTVTQFGATGTAIDGTFTAIVKQPGTGVAINGSGSFHVIRKK